MNVKIDLREIPVSNPDGSIQSVQLNGNGHILPWQGVPVHRPYGVLSAAHVLVPVLCDPTIDNFLTWEYVYLQEGFEFTGLNTNGWAYIGRFETWDHRFKHLFARVQPA